MENTTWSWAPWVLLAPPVAAICGSVALSMADLAYKRWRFRHIPGPKPNIFLGNIAELIKLGGTHEAWPLWHKQYGPVIKCFLMNEMMVLVADADVARTVLFKFACHQPFINPSLKLMDEQLQQVNDLGLVHARDAKWRILRNAWQPAFAPGTLERYKVLMASCAEQLCALLAEDSAATADDGSGCIEMLDMLNKMTLEVVGTCAYGVKFHALPSPGGTQLDASQKQAAGPRLQEACKQYFAIFGFQTSTKWSAVVSLLPHFTKLVSWLAHRFPDQAFKNQYTCIQTIMDVSNDLMRDWRAKIDSQPDLEYRLKQTKDDSQAPAGRLTGVEPGSFLGLLLDAQHKAANNPAADKLDDITITAQTMQFLVAGTETTANTLAFAIYLLSANPEKEAKLLQEVDAHGRDTPITADDKFPYVDAIVKETLRLYPTAHATTRVTTPLPKEGLKLRGYDVYDNTGIALATISLHRDPAYWPRVEEFLPERWLPEGEAELGPRHPNCYMPFGAGTRQCPGYKFAQQEARIALVALYRSFTFKLQPGQVPMQTKSTVTMSPKSGLFVKPIKR